MFQPSAFSQRPIMACVRALKSVANAQRKGTSSARLVDGFSPDSDATNLVCYRYGYWHNVRLGVGWNGATNTGWRGQEQDKKASLEARETARSSVSQGHAKPL